MKTRTVLVALLPILLLMAKDLVAQTTQKEKQSQPLPIIDMHVHSYGDGPFGEKDYYGNPASANAEMLFKETYERFRKYNIVKAVVSGPPDVVERWKSKDEDGRIIRGINMRGPNDFGMTPKLLESLVKEGKIEVFGEIAPFYVGMTLSDPVWRPYLEICEEFDIPVAVHTGGGPPEVTHQWAPKARLVLGDPYLIEDVLVGYPKLRVYMMHAGGAYHDHALRLLACYPKLYTDIAGLLWGEPLTQLYAHEFLKNAKQTGYLDQVMFGSDQIFWPHAIEMSIDYLNSLDFLTEQDKRDILYNNAARFLRLDQSESRLQEPSHDLGIRIPKTYDDAANATWHLPLAVPEVSPSFLSSAYFYARPVRVFYKTYPIYHADFEPEGYIHHLKSVEPEVFWDENGIKPKNSTMEEMRASGELLFDSPIYFRELETVKYFRNREWLEEMDVPVAADGTIPGIYYGIRESGKVEVGIFSCATCHTRVTEQGKNVHGAQGNLPLARIEAWEIENGHKGSREEVIDYEFEYHGTPWILDNENEGIPKMSLPQLAEVIKQIPPGIYPNHNGSIFSPAKTADLFNMKTRRYLDFTGHHRHRNINDLMRFIDFHQWGSVYASFGKYTPQTIPEPSETDRYSDEQAFAIAAYVYSLKSPENPIKPDAAARERGAEIFGAEGCVKCHDPENEYSNHKLTLAEGFSLPVDHPERENVMRRSVQTDPTYALETRKGTGFYKVPSLRGLWLRGPIQHNGACLTLEDWFDRRRLDDHYKPTGWSGSKDGRHAVQGHEFGLDLSESDKRDLIAFLRSL